MDIEIRRVGPGDGDLFDHVADGWTELTRRLKPVLSSRELTAKLGRKPTSEEREFAAEIADYRVMNGIRSRVEEIVQDRATAEGLKPWYRWMCKRPCFHDDYLAAFNSPNVKLVDTQGRGVEEFTRHGIVVGDEEYKVDCVIFATRLSLSPSASSRLSASGGIANGLRPSCG